MNDRGLVAEWLSSANDGLVEVALQFCRWWANQRGDQIAGLLTPYLCRPDPWPRRVGAILPFNLAEDTAALFWMRLRLIGAGIFERHLMAQELAEQHSERLIDLLEAHLDYRHAHPEESDTVPPGERDFPYFIPVHELEHLQKVADALSEPFWARLVVLIIRACDAGREDRNRWHLDSPFFHDRIWSPERRRWTEEWRTDLLRLVARAGARSVTEDPVAFASRFATTLNHSGLSVQYLVGLALAGAGAPAADVAINWLIENPHRLSLPDERGCRWGIAMRLIRQHAAECSAANYSRLEQTILSYHDPDERRSVEWQLTCIRQGRAIRPNHYGLAQHALLPSLPVDRMSDTARSELGVYERKFQRPAVEYSDGYLGRVRSIVGPIPPQRIDRISDRGWLEIIRKAARRWGEYRNLDDRSVADTTADAYAQLLGQQSRWEPQRFAALVQRIPPDTDPAFLSAVIYGLAATTPPNAECPVWQPATDEQVAQVTEHVGYRVEGEIGRSLCWLIRHRAQAISKAECLEILCRYAVEHPNPAPDWTLSEGSEPDNEAAAINCTRGIALGAIGQVLFAQPTLAESLVDVLRRGGADQLPAVRIAAIEAYIPILNTDRDRAVELFLSACDGSEAILGAWRVSEFIRCAQWSHYSQMEPLLQQMANSSLPAVATAGAIWVTNGWLSDQAKWEDIEPYVYGSSAQRLGVATAAAHNCHEPTLSARCCELLSVLMDDPDVGVQDRLTEFLRQVDVLRQPAMRPVAIRFASSLGFARHPSWLIESLRSHPESLIPLAPVFEAICDRLVTDLASVSRSRVNRIGFDLARFVPLVLRLYEQAEQVRDWRLRDACLDWWDRLLEARMGGTGQLLGELDASVTSIG